MLAEGDTTARENSENLAQQAAIQAFSADQDRRMPALQRCAAHGPPRAVYDPCAVTLADSVNGVHHCAAACALRTWAALLNPLGAMSLCDDSLNMD